MDLRLPNDPRLHLTTLGRFEAKLADGKLLEFGGKKPRALLARMVLEGLSEYPRSTLASWLWSEVSEVHARDNLRQAIRAMRVALGRACDDLFDFRYDFIRVEQTRIDADAIFYLRGARPPRVDRADQLDGYNGPLMPDFDDLDPQYDEWLQPSRRICEIRFTNAARDILRAGIDAGRFEADPRLAERLLTIDPTDGTAHEYLARSALDAGDHSAAVRILERVRQLVRSTRDSLLRGELSALRETIAGTIASHVPAPARSIVARPAAGSSAKVRVGFMAAKADAVTDPTVADIEARLLSGLAVGLERFRLFEVAPPFARFPATNAYPLWTGQSGDVDYLITLQVRLGEKPSIDHGLVHCRSGALCLAKVFDLPEPRSEAATGRLVQQMISGITTRILWRSAQQATVLAPDERSEFESYAEADALTERFDLPSARKAEQIFARLVAANETFAAAHSGLATALAQCALLDPLGDSFDNTVRSGLESVRSSIALDPWAARSYTTKAWLHMLLGEHPRASAAFDKAIALNDLDPTVIAAYAQGKAYLGDLPAARKALQMLQASSDGAPGYIDLYKATIDFSAGDYESTTYQLAQADQTTTESLAIEVACLARQNRYKEARNRADLLCGLLKIDRKSSGRLNLGLNRIVLFADPKVRAEVHNAWRELVA